MACPRSVQAIIAACGRFIAEVLKLRFLPMIRPTEWSSPVNILGKWSGNRYPHNPAVRIVPFTFPAQVFMTRHYLLRIILDNVDHRLRQD